MRILSTISPRKLVASFVWKHDSHCYLPVRCICSPTGLSFFTLGLEVLISASLGSWIPSRWKPMHAGGWRVSYPLILRIRSGESHHSCCSLLPSAKWNHFQVSAFILKVVLILIYERGVLESNLWLVMLATLAFIVKQLMCLLGRLVVT